MKALLLMAFCFTACAGDLTLHLDHYVANFTDNQHFTNNLSVLSVSNAVTGTTDTLFYSTDLTNWTPVEQITAPGPVYSTAYLGDLYTTLPLRSFFSEKGVKPYPQSPAKNQQEINNDKKNIYGSKKSNDHPPEDRENNP